MRNFHVPNCQCGSDGLPDDDGMERRMSRELNRVVYGLMVAIVLLLACIFIVYAEANRNSTRIMMLSQRVAQLESVASSYSG